MNRMLLLVFAHPDDESFGVSGIVVKYSRSGIPVELICATRGEKGTRLDVPDDVSTGAAREVELKTAATILGIQRIHFLNYIDGELKHVDRRELTDKVLSIMQRLDPEVVITFGPDGITGHPDHITVGKAATRAFKSLYQQNSSPKRLYYVTLPSSILPDAELATRPDDQIITFNIEEYLGDKIKAIEAHKSQQDAREFLDELRNHENSYYTTKEYLYLVKPRSKIKIAELFHSD